MRKQMKIAAVVSAAALLALGASITSFAAQKGTWKYEDGEWYCYNKNGDVYESTFCLSNGKEFYVGDDGALVRSSWVEYEGEFYFVNSAGEKITNDWRLTTPYEDEDSEEQWFYFQSTGKRAQDKKLLIKGKTYFFNGEGEMLTGWVQKSGDTWDEGSTDDVKDTETYYCDETGARLESTWVYDYAPSVDRDDVGDEEEHHYYLRSNGKVQTGKASNIKGQTYFFDNSGKMLSGWVAKTSSDAGYVEIWTADEEDKEFSLSDLKEDVYFCSDEDDGHMKKNKWIKLWPNQTYGLEDDDKDKYWFYIEKNGEIFIPSESDATVTKYKFMDGEGDSFDTAFDADKSGVEVATKKINGKTYLFDMNGQMVSKFVMNEETGLLYYYGGSDEGDRKDGSLSIKDDAGEAYRFYFATENKPSQGYYNAAGITGAKSGKLYENGFLLKANNYKYELKTVENVIDGESGTLSFIVNSSGSIQTSENKKYEEDDDLLINIEGAKFRKESVDKGVAYGSVTGATALYK